MATYTHHISIQAAGDSANGAPAFSLYVNGQLIAANVDVTTNFSSGNWENFSYAYNSSLASDSIKIVYGNDFYDPSTGADRNLYINSVTLDGNAFQAALTPGATTVLGPDGSTTSAALYGNGSLTWTTSEFAPATTGHLQYLGVNYSGAEFSAQQMAAWNTTAVFPTSANIDYYASKGLNIIRLPINWEHLQPTKDGAMNTAYLGQIENVVNYAATKGIKVIIDPHNFGFAYGAEVGGSSTTNADFANFWGRLAGALSQDKNVMFGLMNEPHVQSPSVWLGSVNAAIHAIRAAGATSQTILVPGTDWDGSDDWVTTGNAATIGKDVIDPSNNYAFEVHEYFDTGSSGTSTAVISPDIGVQRLQAVTQWALDNHQRLFLGEVGSGADSTSLTTLNNTLAYMRSHSNVWMGATYWDAGQPNDPFAIDPVNGVDKPQLTVLQRYAPNPNSAASTISSEVAGATANVVASGSDTVYQYTGGAYFGAQPFKSMTMTYGQTGQLVGQSYFNGADMTGGAYLTDSVHMNGTDVDFDYSGGSFFNGKAFDSEEKTFGQNGALALQTLDNRNGSHTFAFGEGFGSRQIAGFTAGGAAHDTISVHEADFADFATLIRDAQNVGANAVITAANHDTITIDNMTKAMLQANPGDFSFQAG